MRAIVLTYDDRHKYAELLYNMYMKLWPECEINFHIPYNQNFIPFMSERDNITLVNCDKDINTTMELLLDGLSDDDWVYWCCDDRFPTRINTQQIKRVYKNVHQLSEYDFIKPYTHPLCKPHTQYIDNDISLQASGPQWGFWMHHFCKVGVLRDVFSQPNCKTIYDYHDNILTGVVMNNISGICYNKNLITFGEPTIEDQLTEIGAKYLENITNNEQNNT